MNNVKLKHKEMTDEESYQNIKELYKENKKIYMDPKEWKRLREMELKKAGLNWSS